MSVKTPATNMQRLSLKQQFLLLAYTQGFFLFLLLFFFINNYLLLETE